MKNHIVTFAALLALAVAACGGPEQLQPTETLAQASTAGGISTLRLSSTTAAAGTAITATVSLSGSANSSSGGVIVYLAFQNAILAGPKFIRIPNGLSSGTATFYANPFLSAPASASITANTSSPQPSSFVIQTLSLTPSLTPPTTPRPQVSSLTLSPATVVSGSPVTGIVTLTDPAPPEGAAVQLSSSNDFFNLDAELPPVVIVPAGATSASFTVRTHISNSAVTSAQEIIVGNYFGGTFQGAYLTIHRP
jgi:hypothetical protein